MNKSYGQTYINYVEGTSAACTPAVALNCANDDDELHPIPGKTYTYGVTTDPTTVASIHWFVTDVSPVIAAGVLTPTRDVINGDYILNAGPSLLAGSANYDDDANTTAQISIAWKSFNATSNNVLLVAYVSGADGCSDNIEVYKIEPSIGFTLDIAGLLDDGTLGDEECLSPVESATYDGTAGNLATDYGENWIFFSVNAANFVHSWQPDFTTTYTGAGTVSAVEWAYPADALANTNWNAETAPVLAQDASGAVGVDGECIVLRVRIDHGTDELDASVAAAVLTMGVDGIMYDSENANYTNTDLADLDNGATPTDPCLNNVTDEADYTLTPRPSITTNTVIGTGDLDFEPKN